MNLPSDPVIWLKVVGAGSTAAGSILLALRVRILLKWVVFCLVAHEQAITQLRKMAANRQQDHPIVEGVTRHLLDLQSKVGIILLVLGFLLLGIGMLCNMVTYLV